MANHNQPRLLALFAHPDDESYGAGGTLARYAAEGVQVYVVIATDGAAGSANDSPSPSGRELAQIRAAELAQATAILGITGCWNLGHYDSGMEGTRENQHPQALVQQPMEAVVEEMVDLIRRLSPQVIITHDLQGGYGHPDHRYVSQAATTAFHTAIQLAGGPAQRPQKLYYTAWDARVFKAVLRLLSALGLKRTAFGRNKDIDIFQIGQGNLPVNARLDVSAYATRKDAAIRAHASQYTPLPFFVRVLSFVLGRYFTHRETFSRVYPESGPDLETDLFAGISFSG